MSPRNWQNHVVWLQQTDVLGALTLGRSTSIGKAMERAGEALSYNTLAQSWPEKTRLSRGLLSERTAQEELF